MTSDHGYAQGSDDPKPGEVVVSVPVPNVGDEYFPEKLITEWHVASGQRIQQGAPLFSVSTDKTDVEVESPATGTVEILIPCGSTARAGEIAALIRYSKTTSKIGHP